MFHVATKKCLSPFYLWSSTHSSQPAIAPWKVLFLSIDAIQGMLKRGRPTKESRFSGARMRCSRLKDQRFKGLDWPPFHNVDHHNVSPSTRSPNLSLPSLIPHKMFRVSTNRPSVDHPNWSGDAEWPGRFCNPVTAMQGTKHSFCSFVDSRSIVY
jgi:hypothetical protein